MGVELSYGSIKAIVDLQGAYIESLADNKGDIFFPKMNLKTADGAIKQRGGCHICLPNFGPGGMSGLKQHGFGREVEWEVADRTDSSVLLILREGIGEYHDMESVLTYQLAPNMLMITLELVNHGKSALRAAPAFHPYFAVTNTESVYLDDELQKLDTLAEAKFFTGDEHTLSLSNRVFTFRTNSLSMWAKWSDQPERYICVEPSLDGFSFLKDNPSEDELLKPNEQKSYTMSITWN